MRGCFGLLLCLLLAGPALAADSPKVPPPLGSKKKAKSDSSKPRQLQPSDRLTRFDGGIASLAFSPDDKTLAVGLREGIQLIDIKSKDFRRELATKSGPVRALVFSPDGKLLLAGSDQRATLWDPAIGQVVQELQGHRGIVTGVAFSPDGERFATSCEDETVRIWALKEDKPTRTVTGFLLPVTGVAWSPNGQRVAVSVGDESRPTLGGRILVQGADGKGLPLAFTMHAKAVTGVAFSPDGNYLASSSIDQHVNVYDLGLGKPLGYFGGHSRPTNAVLFHPDGESAVSISGARSGKKNELKIWEFLTGDEIATAEAHESKVSALAISHDGRTIATGGQDKTVALWDVGFLAYGSQK